jgi:CDGSH-type Zn-finger protein
MTGARITPYRDGPLLVRGPFTLTDQDGNEIPVRGGTIALCRCGRSRRKPFCDGMHKAVSWRAASGAQPLPGEEDPAPRFACGSTSG